MLVEVGAFTERRQVEHIKDPGVVKDELISALKSALKSPERAMKEIQRIENKDTVVDHD